MQIGLELGDITRISADVIVNAANSMLIGGGGVDGAIHSAAGPSVMAELDVIRKRIGQCPTGRAVITGAGKLNAKYIVHAVGPVYRGGGNGEPELLASCYRESLRLAAEKQAVSVAFPAISAGVYGYPIHEAAAIAIAAVRQFGETPSSVEDVRFVLYSPDALAAFERAL